MAVDKPDAPAEKMSERIIKIGNVGNALLALVYLAGAVGSFAAYTLGHPRFTIGGFAALLGLTCACIYFQKRIPPLVTKVLTAVRKAPSSQAVRFTALVGLAASTILIIAAIIYEPPHLSHIRAAAPSKCYSSKFCILVADFGDTNEEKQYGITNSLLERLRDVLSNYPGVEVASLGKAITEQDGDQVAREDGIDNKADVVIWGWYAANKVGAYTTIHFELLNALPEINFRGYTESIKSPVEQLENFTIQPQLSASASYVTLITLGLVSYKAHDYDGAISRLSGAISQSDALVEPIGSSIIYFYLGASYLAQGAYSSAVNYFNTSIRINHYIPAAYNNRANAFAGLGKNNQAIADYTRAISMAPGDYLARLNRGIARFSIGDIDGAISDYSRAISISANFYASYLLRGIVQFAKRKYTSAVIDFTKVIQLDRANPLAYYNRAESLFALNNYREAQQDDIKAVLLDPKFVPAYNDLGDDLFKLGYVKQAITNYSHAINIDPTFIPSYLNRAKAYERLNNYPEAIFDYSRIISLSPNRPLITSVYFDRAVDRGRLRDYRGALQDFIEVAHASQKWAGIYNNIGIIRAYLHEYREAATDFRHATQLVQRFADAFNNLGHAYLILRRDS